MSTAVATQGPRAVADPINPAVLASVILDGDLARLNDAQRVDYMVSVCKTLGLNPATKPFEFLRLNGKLVMYARRDATEQLRKIHGVSITIKAREVINGVYVVTANAQDASGRVDESTGAVPVENVKGENLANAMMKAETKAKRRVTLSICGLGMLDESEVESARATEPLSMTQEQRNAAASSTNPADMPTHNLEEKAEATRLWELAKKYDKSMANVIRRECGTDAAQAIRKLGELLDKHGVDHSPVVILGTDEASNIDEAAAAAKE